MKHKAFFGVVILLLLGVFTWIGYPFALKRIVLNRLESALGKGCEVTLDKACFQDTKLYLKGLVVTKGNRSVKIDRTEITTDPWAYLWGRRVLDSVDISGVEAFLRVGEKTHWIKGSASGFHFPKVNNFCMHNAYVNVVSSVGKSMARASGNICVKVSSGHGSAYSVTGDFQVISGGNAHKGHIRGSLDSAKHSDIVLSLDSPVTLPFYSGGLEFKDIRFHQGTWSFPSVSYTSPEINFNIHGLTIRMTRLSSLLSLFRKKLPSVQSILVDGLELYVILPLRTAPNARLTVKQLFLSLLNRSEHIAFNIKKLVSRVSRVPVDKMNVLSFTLFWGEHRLFTDANFVFSRDQQGWRFLLQSPVGKHLSINYLNADSMPRVTALWRAKDCALLGLDSRIIPDSGCVSEIKTELVFKKDKDLTMHVNTHLGPVQVTAPLLAEQPIELDDLKVDTSIHLMRDSLSLSPLILKINKGLTINSDINLSSEPASVRVHVKVPPNKAMTMFRALPLAMKDRIADIRFAGVFSFEGDLNLDLDDLSKTKLSLHPDCSDLKVVTVPPSMQVDTLSKDFVQVINTDDKEIRREIGPDSPDWCPLDSIPPYFIDCLLASEDVTFFQHKGFSVFSIREALVDDLVRGRVVRGASTITQQLAKNLFLSREKSLSRKLQEAILTWYLEQNLSKQRILELYLNIIEWGPNIYGIRQASLHYFGKEPSDLDLSESAFLVSIIPNPVLWHQKLQKLKKVPSALMYKIKKIFKVLLTRHTIDTDILKEALEEQIDFNPQIFQSKTISAP